MGDTFLDNKNDVHYDYGGGGSHREEPELPHVRRPVDLRCMVALVVDSASLGIPGLRRLLPITMMLAQAVFTELDLEATTMQHRQTISRSRMRP